MSVWRAEPHEAETVARLLVGFRDHLGGLRASTSSAGASEHPPSHRPSDNAILATVERLIEQPEVDFLLGAPDDDSPPAGVCQLRYRLSVWMAAPDCWLEDLFVEDAARGHGVGAGLLEAALARARERGCRRVELDTAEDNAAALALYHRFGFSERSKSDPARDLFLGLRL